MRLLGIVLCFAFGVLVGNAFAVQDAFQTVSGNDGKDVKIDGLSLNGFETFPPLAEVPDRWKLKPGVVPHATPY